MKLSFWGATKQVTGSMFLLELDDGYKILIDCGLNLEPKKKSFKDNGLPFEASSVNLVLLTHAHIDHSGNIPNLFKEGYEGQVLSTLPTYYLAHLLLMDSARINQLKLNSLLNGKNKNRKKFNKKAKSPSLYLENQVKEALQEFVPIAFNQKFKVNESVSVTFNPTSHLLGAANILLEIKENGKTKTMAFSGDLGRKNYPLLPDPIPIPEVDYLICETTYGARLHQDKENPEHILEKIIHQSCIETPGRLIIPSFSVGRTQALLYTLNKLYSKNKFQPIKIFVDSPLAIESTKVHQHFVRFMNQEAKDFDAENETLFDFESLIYIEKNKQSKAISNYFEPCIIISSSGMLEGGRIKHHIQNNIENPYCTILMIGHSTEGTLGNKLLEGRDEILLNNVKYEVRAKIARTDVFSGHGDQNDLLDFVETQNPKKLKKLFLVHGEYESMLTFQNLLAEKEFNQTIIPEYGESFDL